MQKCSKENMLNVQKNKKPIPLTYILFLLVFILVTMLYGYTQLVRKETISAVLQYQLDLRNPPESIFAISTCDQKLSGGRQLLKGTRFIGMLHQDEKGLAIYFSAIETVNGKKEQFFAKTILSAGKQDSNVGVSARISKTLYQQTKTNVLGAIFNSASETQKIESTVLPRSSTLKLEVD